MTCDDCQAIIIDTSRGGDVDRALRDEARRHAALCSRCGELQQEQQWLTTRFRALAAADAGRQAPERVEIAALAAWRAEFGSARAESPASTLAVAPAVASTRMAARRWLLPGVAVAGLAAAAVAMIVVLPASRVDRRNVATTTSPTPSAPTLTAERIRPAEPGTAGTRAESLRNRESEGASAPVATTPDSKVAGREVVTPREAMPVGHVESVLAQATTGDPEFLPLPYVEPLRSTEARHVVRVSMTSGDEMILGVLPADRRTGQPFEADVLVGEDGIARAIRIVR